MSAAAEPKKLGRYDLASTLGKGAMGVVYEGIDPRLNRRVAIKTILKSHLDEDLAKEYSMRFEREAKAVARLNHPNIVQVYDFGEEGDVAYLVMEFIRGKELKNFFDANERFDMKESVRIMCELLDALEFAHNAGIVHRDIKPANVMLDGNARVKLTDFGVARLQDSDKSAAERTQAGTMVGTPAYMSPEQITGGQVDNRSDLFSAGIILYQFLTGEKPFTGSGAWTIAKKIIQENPPLPSSVNGSVSPLFDNVVNKALAKDPTQRFQSAKEFGLALKSALEGRAGGDDGDATVVAGAGGDFIDLGATIAAPRPAGLAAAATGTQQKAMSTGTQTGQEVELEFWRAIKDGNDPDDFELYVQQFPNGIYAALAKRKIAKLRGVAPEETGAKAKAQEEQEKKELEEAARREAEVKAKLEAERARLEAEMAKREAETKAEMERREAETAAKLEALERARQEAAEKAEAARQEAAEKAERAAQEAERARQEAAEKAEKARLEAEQRAEKARLEAEAAAAKREAESRAKLEALEKARKEAELAAAKREAEAKARLEAAEKARQEAMEKQRKEAEALIAKQQAEAKAKLEAAEKARQEMAERAKREAEAKAQEFAKREAQLKKEVAEAPKKSPVKAIVITLAVAIVGGGGYYYWAQQENRAKMAEVQKQLEEAKKRDAEYQAAKSREAELQKQLELARKQEEEARKSGDIAKQKALAEARERAEAEAKKQADATKAAEQNKLAADKAAASTKQVDAKAAAEKAKQAEAQKAAAAAATAAADKAAADKFAAEKAALEAERQKIAAERAAAEKAAADARAAAEKAKAEQTKIASAAPAPSGGAEALYEQGVALESQGNFAEAVKVLRSAARGGSGKAAKKLGDIYNKGAGNVARDYAESLKWYNAARVLGEDVPLAKSR